MWVLDTIKLKNLVCFKSSAVFFTKYANTASKMQIITAPLFSAYIQKNCENSTAHNTYPAPISTNNTVCGILNGLHTPNSIIYAQNAYTIQAIVESISYSILKQSETINKQQTESTADKALGSAFFITLRKNFPSTRFLFG